MPSPEGPAAAADGGEPATRPALDPVDLALLMKAQAQPSRARSASRRRYTALVVMGIVFVVLMILGMVMVSHVHPGASGTSGAQHASAVARIVRGVMRNAGRRPVNRSRA